MTKWATGVIEGAGYAGLGGLIALENVFPPIPSELILPLAGFLTGQGKMSYTGAVAAATAGSVAGAWVLYYVGRRLGEERLRRWIDEHGKWILVSCKNLDHAEKWFEKHGTKAVLIGRCVPGVRSLISVPAGIKGMPLPTFTFYTALGSAVWNAILVGLGWYLGRDWERVGHYIGYFEKAVWIGLAALVLVVVFRKLRRRRAQAA